jgi:hypothetical protein
LKNNKLHKALHWEYWPAAFFYVPNLPFAFYLAAKAKHSTFFSAANPSIKSSGNGTESKTKTMQLVPIKYRPISVLHKAKCAISITLNSIKKENIQFPLIVKPDIGYRGLLVQKIHTEIELKNYLKKYPLDIIIEEFLEFKNECGIFYHRNPNKKKGKISSITLKKFLTVIGDGRSTLKELIDTNSRAKLYLDLLLEIHQNKLEKIPKNKQQIELSVIGNHSKGTQFICGNHLISKKLEKTFDELKNAIPGWYYGRIDIKYNSFEELENGENFKILEINGIIAEPTHMYDTENYTYFQALKAIRTHWKSLYEIATTNHKMNDSPYKSAHTFINELLELRAHNKKVVRYSKN